jgi:hypothetical protein
MYRPGPGGGGKKPLKFSCQHCGKRFASVDEPAPGRVYRIRCRCGDVIVVRGPPAPGERRTRHGGEGRARAKRGQSARAPARKAGGASAPPPLPGVDAAGGPAHLAASPAKEPTPAPVITDDPFARAVAEAIAATGRQEVTARVDAAPHSGPAPVPPAVVATAEDVGETSVELSVSEAIATDESPRDGRSPLREPLRLRTAVAVAIVVVAMGAGAGARVMRGRSAAIATAAPVPTATASSPAPLTPEATPTDLPTVAIHATFPSDRAAAPRPHRPARTVEATPAPSPGAETRDGPAPDPPEEAALRVAPPAEIAPPETSASPPPVIETSRAEGEPPPAELEPSPESAPLPAAEPAAPAGPSVPAAAAPDAPR